MGGSVKDLSLLLLPALQQRSCRVCRCASEGETHQKERVCLVFPPPPQLPPFHLTFSCYPSLLSFTVFPSFLPSSLRCICPLLVYLPALTHSVTESSSSPSSSIVYFWMPISSLLSTLPYFLSPATAYLLPLCSQMKPSSSLCITRAYT